MIKAIPQVEDFKDITKWLLGCFDKFSPLCGNYQGNSIMLSPDSCRVNTAYLDGTINFTKSYAIQCYFTVTEDFKIFDEDDISSSENISAYQTAKAINEWINKQNLDRNFPNIPKWDIDKVEPTSQMPNFDGIQEGEDVSLARFTIFLEITYNGKL